MATVASRVGMCFAIPLFACATQNEMRVVPVAADSVRKAMTDVGTRKCTLAFGCPPASRLRDEDGRRHDVDADTLVGVPSEGQEATSSVARLPMPSVALPRLWADCTEHPATSKVPCPVTGSQATYLALVRDSHTHVDTSKLPFYLVGGALVAGVVAGEAECFSKWCNSTSRSVVIGADIAAPIVALGLWATFEILTISSRGD